MSKLMRRVRWSIVPSLFLMLLALPCAADILTPVGDLDAAWILSGGDTKEYFLVSGDQPAELDLEGPGTLRIFFRAHYPGKTKDLTTITARIAGVKKIKNLTVQAQVKRSSSAQYDDDRAGRPSGGGKVEWVIPKGTHLARITANASTGEPVYAVFYHSTPKKTSSGGHRLGPFTWKGKAYLGFVYDDNPIHYSEDDLLQFRRSGNPDKFEIVTYDDLILNPKITLYLYYPTPWFARETEFRFRFNGWRYTSNHVKHNESLFFQLRQRVRKSDYFEVFFQYNPEQYIRSFRARDPYVSRWSANYEYTHFLYTRNEMEFGYKCQVNKTLALKPSLRRQWKYYNSSFMDNDLWVWAYRLDSFIRLSARWRSTFRYELQIVDSRGYDTTEESKENSNDSNSDHHGDKYQLVFQYRPPRSLAGKWYGPKKIEWDFDHSVSWYSSDKPIWDDPLHVGRKDTQWAGQLRLFFPFVGRTTMEIAYKYSQRKVESPYEGEFIGDEKDYVSNRVWVALESPF
ncbi:MAG: hypothetical protein KAW17_03370 [Candidatus Eisenbacteria sp.]|nr:hypothetical protein [Candidatus Eisenbacteria bacterium]